MKSSQTKIPYEDFKQLFDDLSKVAMEWADNMMAERHNGVDIDQNICNALTYLAVLILQQRDLSREAFQSTMLRIWDDLDRSTEESISPVLPHEN